MVQLNSPFCKEKEKETTKLVTTFNFYHPMVSKCSKQICLTHISKIVHDSLTKRLCSSNNHLGLFYHFLAGLERLQASAQSHRENWHADEAATDSVVRNKSVLRIRTF